MKNRWNIDIKRGMSVTAHHPRSGTIDGTIVKLEKEGVYGWVASLDSGYTVSIDDIITITMTDRDKLIARTVYGSLIQSGTEDTQAKYARQFQMTVQRLADALATYPEFDKTEFIRIATTGKYSI